MSRDRFDLHTHSTASDGTLPPREVIGLAAERGLAGVALTDHDTTDGLAEAMGMAEALGIRCIPGVELSCFSPTSRESHLLGYFIDPDDAGLAALFAEMRAQRVERAAAIRPPGAWILAFPRRRVSIVLSRGGGRLIDAATTALLPDEASRAPKSSEDSRRRSPPAMMGSQPRSWPRAPAQSSTW